MKGISAAFVGVALVLLLVCEVTAANVSVSHSARRREAADAESAPRPHL